MKKTIFIITILLLQSGFLTAQQFSVSFPSAVYKGPFTGNVILYLSEKNEQPKNYTGYPCYRMQVQHIQSNEPVIFSDASLSYPTLLSKIHRGRYYVQAVFDLNLEGRIIGLSVGNLYSAPQQITIDDTAKVFNLVCDKVIPNQVFVETKFVKEIKAYSALLSRFYKKPVTLNAPVILPKEYYEQPDRRFPVYFMVAGFGSDYHHYSSSESSDTLPSIPLDTIPCIKIYLDGNCSFGHSTYANSDNNGPVGDAFAYEFLPELDKRFRTNGARLIRGHSSGGWTVVYLLTHYADLFVAGNASAPDPVDFRWFSFTDLYLEKKLNMYVDGLTMHRPSILDSIAYDRPNIAHSIEKILYRGGQNVSFNAVFGPKGIDGLPEPMFDLETLAIDPAVVNHWKTYDLTQYTINHWPDLKKLLPGKLRVSVGTEDSVQNLAIRSMENEMRTLRSDIEFAYYPGNHFTVVTAEYKKAWDAFLEKKYLQWLNRKMPGK